MENYDLDILIKVCNLKYKEKIQQKEIAKQLKLSTAKVTRLLQKAFELDIAKVVVNDSNLPITKLESDLEKKFHLRRVFISKSENQDAEKIKKNIGQRIAGYLMAILKDRDCMGISQSSTIKEVIQSLPLHINKKVDVAQMLGGSYSTLFEGMDQTKELSDRFGVTPHILYAPLFVDNSRIKKAILQNSSIKESFDFFRNLNIALVGMGAFYPIGSSITFRSGNLTKEEIKELEEHNVAGDMYGYFLDKDGNFCNTSIEKRVITIPKEYIPRIELRIGVAGGLYKFDIIYAALKGKLINILATDEDTGQKLLSAP
jgi:deoxyribonucleoside regulator